jgi:uncharacterized membrane protein YuzA (DUF378 family)
VTRFVLAVTYLAAIAVGIFGGFQVFDLVTK